MAAGLGNPGPFYADTRHNIGFMVLDRAAARSGASPWRRDSQRLLAEASLSGRAVLLVKPQTYMNRSGAALRDLFAEEPLSDPSDLIVVHDDLDLPFGTLRIRAGGGHGGHNGVRSLIEELGTAAFCRVKCGVGRPPPGVEAADYVLSPFAPEELPALPDFIGIAADALETILAHGPAEAMQRFHTQTQKEA